ncbi:Hydrolase_4 domain-containing protein [Rhodovastum atsumiense]|uniref:Serine aminopeptidase S33 domain-containing protein n=1 Tax=Rhodovastum atsumiense TaxID=504468 RepID=A0A5M6J2H3_9PROT|nr:alpha/beta hydrolase [Rhodovastum atsumiense]KAA5614307.1 hypothetical protein F1189_01550 [Rhodovastum atsumiense]CAH2604767.1 Hydrolase_4 domain-containing protein [Rhodovastum atsumiense]
MIPVAFHGHAGWLHGPVGKRGVVICSPWGEEALCTHRALRALAIHLAARGFAVLRFDHRGTGDSLGEDGTLPGWVDGIVGAASFLRAQAGVRHVAVLGLRLGAMLAAAAAPRCAADEVVLLAPPGSGPSFLRETRATALLSEEAEQDPDGTLRHAGFALTPALQRELTAVDPFPAVGARRVLVLDRDPQGATARTVRARLRKGGAEITSLPFDELPDLLQDARLARTPDVAWETVADWLTPAEPSADWPSPPPAILASDGFSETGLLLQGGTMPALAAVLCEPAEPVPATPLAVFLNAGSVRRIGPGRFAVTAARALAAAGITSLRLDAPGTGDSDDAIPDATAPEGDTWIAELLATLGLLQTPERDRLALVGIGAGAEMAWQATLADPRVISQVLVNPERLDWPETTVPEAAVGESPLRRLLRALREGWAKLGANARPDHGRVQEALRLLQARGVRTMLVYAPGSPAYAAFIRQFGPNGHLLHRRSGALWTVLEGGDRALTRPAARARLLALLRAALAPPTLPMPRGVRGPAPFQAATAPKESARNH